ADRLAERRRERAVVARVRAQPRLQSEASVLAHAGADIWSVESHVDAGGSQDVRRPDPGELEQPGRLEAPERENHFAAGIDVLERGSSAHAHAGDAVAVEEQLG